MTDLPAGSRLAGFRSGLVGHFIYDRGEPGTPGPAGNFVNKFRGAWASGTAYAAGDIVTNAGSSWLALAGSTGATPAEGASWTKVAAAGGDGAGVPVGGASGQVLTKSSGTSYDTVWADASGGGGGPIARAAFASPAAARNTTSTTIVDINNLSVTFTATTATVDVILQGYAYRDLSTAGITSWGLMVGSTPIAGALTRVHGGNGTAQGVTARVAIRISGLTVGDSYTYKWGHATDTGRAAFYHNTESPAIMEVYAR